MGELGHKASNGTNGRKQEEEVFSMKRSEEEGSEEDEEEYDSEGEEKEEEGRAVLGLWWGRERARLQLQGQEVAFTVQGEPEEPMVTVECRLGHLTAEGEGANIDLAQDQAALLMLDQLKNILEEEGDEGLRRNILEEPDMAGHNGGEEEEGRGQGPTANRNVVEEATLDSSEEEDDVEAEEEKEEQRPAARQAAPQASHSTQVGGL